MIKIDVKMKRVNKKIVSLTKIVNNDVNAHDYQHNQMN